MTAVPPRPAAPDVTAGDGPHADCIERGCGSVAGCYPEPCRLDHPATAGDGLREAIAARICPGDYCEAHSECLDDADYVLALPALRDVLAAAARDTELRAEAASLLADVDRGYDPKFGIDRIRRALDGTR